MSTNASWQQASNLLTLVSNKGTPSEQIQKLYSSGLLSDLLDANIDQINRDEFRKVIGLIALEPPSTPLLEFLPPPVVYPAIKCFVAKEVFKENNADGVKVAWIGENFKRVFLTGGGKVEESVPACEHRFHRLNWRSTDAPILTDFADRATTTLAHFWESLKRQPRGEAGQLLTNGWSTVSYILDDAGVPWAVARRWGFDGWGMEATSVDRPSRWNECRRFVSR